MSDSPKRPTISIGLPLYNVGKYSRTAIESVLNQTYTELIGVGQSVLLKVNWMPTIVFRVLITL